MRVDWHPEEEAEAYNRVISRHGRDVVELPGVSGPPIFFCLADGRYYDEQGLRLIERTPPLMDKVKWYLRRVWFHMKHFNEPEE